MAGSGARKRDMEVGSVLVGVLTACGRLLLAAAFWLASVMFHSVHVSGLEHDDGAPTTYFALAHKRDQDPFILLPPLIAHRGWRALVSDVRFALRGDAFAAGFLARMAPRPRWLARLLRPLDLRYILPKLGIYPIQSLWQPAEAWIRAYLRLENDRPAAEVLAPAFLESVAASAGQRLTDVAPRPLSHLLAWRYQPYLQRYHSVDIFLPEPRRVARQLALAAATRYRADLAAWLASGGSLLGAPAGQLSPDGGFGTSFAGLHRLLRVAPAGTRVIPLTITYDFMTTGRPRVFVDVAPAIPAFAALAPARRDAALLAAWRSSAYITCTQLCAAVLVEGAVDGWSTCTFDNLFASVRSRAARLAAAGNRVDPHLLLDARRCRRLVARFLRYCARHGLAVRGGDGAWTWRIGDTVMRVPSGEVGYREFPLLYAWNELRELTGGAVVAPGHYQRLETHG